MGRGDFAMIIKFDEVDKILFKQVSEQSREAVRAFKGKTAQELIDQA
jgi:hypothetical protein